MSRITGITPQKKDKTRCNIELDGRFYCGMKLETVARNRLQVGQEIAGEELARIQLESEKQTAFDKALTHITATMKTEKEIRTFLAGKGYLEDVIDDTIERMKNYGFLDDEAYAKSYAESVSKRKGSRLIAQELRKKGVPDEAIEGALSSVEGETESAREVLRKYLRGKDLSDRKTVQKAYSHLLSRGFGYDTAREALSALVQEDGES